MKTLTKSYSPFQLFYTGLFCLLFPLFLEGCVIIINQPSSEEKELLAIQDTVEKQMTDVSQKITSSNYDNVQKADFITQAENTVQQAVQRINELKIPEKTKHFAEETQKYLDYAAKIFKQLKDLLKDIDRLKEESLKLGSKAEETLNVQIKNIQNGIDFFGQKIDQTAKSLQSVRTQILNLYNSTN